MKKLLILSLVLGMASLASAGFQLNVTYEDGTAYDGATLEPSDYLLIDVVKDDFTSAIYNQTLALIVDPTTGSGSGGTVDLSGDLSGQGGAADTVLIWDDMGDPGWKVDEGVAMQISILGGVYMGPYTFFGDILFHCEGPDEATVQLVAGVLDGTEYIPGEVLATVVIPQTPEPATMGLLALGGLFLRRRK